MNIYDVDHMNKLLARVRLLMKQNRELALRVQQLTTELKQYQVEPHAAPYVIPINLPVSDTVPNVSSADTESVPLVDILDTPTVDQQSKPKKGKKTKQVE